MHTGIINNTSDSVAKLYLQIVLHDIRLSQLEEKIQGMQLPGIRGMNP